MLHRFRTDPAIGNSIALVCLFVVLGGSAYAATQLPNNSVGANQIRKNAVAASEIKKDAVSRSEIKRNGVSADEIATNAVNADELNAGSVGASEVINESLSGLAIANGTIALADLGPNSVDGSKVVEGSLGGGDVAPGTFLGGKVTVQFEQAAAALGETATGQGTSYDVHCPEGQIAIGGGGRGDATDSEFTVTHSSRPITSTTSASPPVDNGTFTGWRITVTNPVGDLPQDAGSPGPADGDILPEVWVICAALP
ncbi:MAG: hypothetical protein M3340_06855 [Actinomycetota bacterium]|nr:hypothetical protein [Actinomycetota bacterium]